MTTWLPPSEAEERRRWLAVALVVWLGLVWLATVAARHHQSATVSETIATSSQDRIAGRLVGVAFHYPGLTESIRSQLLETAHQFELDPLQKKVVNREQLTTAQIEKLEGWYQLQASFDLDPEPDKQHQLVQRARSDLVRLGVAGLLVLGNGCLGLVLLIAAPLLWTSYESVFQSRGPLLLALGLYFCWDFLSLLGAVVVASVVEGTLLRALFGQIVSYVLALVMFGSLLRRSDFQFDSRTLGGGLVGFWLCAPLVFLAAQLTQRLSGKTPSSTNPLLEMITNSTQNELLLLVGLVVVVGPLFEEIVFRGVLYRNLRSRFGVPVSALLSGLIFSVVHGDLMAVLPLTTLGIVFALLYEKTNSLWASWICHALWNGATVLLLLLLY